MSNVKFSYSTDGKTVPKWIKESVIKKCKRFANLSVCKAFFVTEVADGK